MSATPARFAENLSRTNDAALLQSRMAACQWFLCRSESRLATLANEGASQASLQAERLSIARNKAAIEAINAKLEQAAL